MKRRSKKKAHTWSKCNNRNTQSPASNPASPTVKRAHQKVKVPTHNNPANIQTGNCKSEGGNGLTPSSRVLVLAPEADTAQLCQEPRSSFLVGTISQAKLKGTLISTILTFSMSMPTNSRNQKSQEHLQHQGTLILPCWQGQRSLSLEEEEPREKYLGTCMLWILLR